jgi:hypothetical protein
MLILKVDFFRVVVLETFLSHQYSEMRLTNTLYLSSAQKKKISTKGNNNRGWLLLLNKISKELGFYFWSPSLHSVSNALKLTKL